MTLGRSRTLELEPGSHTVGFRLSTADYRDSRTVRVELEPDSERTLRVPLGRPGLLSVQASLGSPQGVVYLDGEVLGLSPIRSKKLPPGQHHLQVFAVDHPTIALADQRIEIRSDREAVLTFDLTGQRQLAVRERPISSAEDD